MEVAAMPDGIPNAGQMTTLVGKSLYAIWNQLCASIDENTIRSICGAKAVKPGHMSINTVGAVKLCARCMQGKIA